MEQFYIDSQKNNRNLYSIYHRANVNKDLKKGVLLCYPVGQEYIRCHKAFSKLAIQLANNGFHVIRFDYHGTGDSSGEFHETDINSLVEDIGMAIKELQESGCVNELLIAGARLGATLAIISAKKYNINKCLMWSPIILGKNYINNLVVNNNHFYSGSFARIKLFLVPKNAYDILGFNYPKKLIADIKKINLIENWNDIFLKNLLLIDSKDSESYRFYTKNKAKPGIQFIEIIEDNFWIKKNNERDKSLVPVADIDNIISWMLNK